VASDSDASPSMTGSAVAQIIARMSSFENNARPQPMGSRASSVVEQGASPFANFTAKLPGSPQVGAGGTVLNDAPYELHGRSPVRDPVTLTAVLLSDLQNLCERYAVGSGSASSRHSSSSSLAGLSSAAENEAFGTSSLGRKVFFDDEDMSSTCGKEERTDDSDVNGLDDMDVAIPRAFVTQSMAQRGRDGLGFDNSDIDHLLRCGKKQAIVDVSKLIDSAEFQEFEASSSDLKAVDPSALTSRDAKAAFAINLYNLLSLHARIRLGVPTNRADRTRLNHRVYYLVGSQAHLCLDDISTVLLRNERRSGISRLIQKAGRSAEEEFHRKLAVQPVMPEALCAICATASSYDPPIRVFYTEHLSADLAEVVDRFLCKWVRPRAVPNDFWTARVPLVFSMYRNEYAVESLPSATAALSEDQIVSSVIDWIMHHVTSNAQLSQRLSHCNSLEYHRVADAFQDERSGQRAFSPLFWS
jgi:Protein of unknown function, DUF547